MGVLKIILLVKGHTFDNKYGASSKGLLFGGGWKLLKQAIWTHVMLIAYFAMKAVELWLYLVHKCRVENL